MNERAGQSQKELALRKYFMLPPVKPSYGCGIALLIFGAIIGLIALSAASDGDGVAGPILVAILPLAGGALWISLINSRYRKKIQEGEPKPPDGQVQNWLTEGVQRLSDNSRQALGLTEKEGSTADPIVIVAPILWETQGVGKEDLVWKRGGDGSVRFGVYKVTIIYLTDRHLGAYACDYNFLREVALNERTDEYHYQDIVSVSTREQSTSFTLPTGDKLTTAQQFMLSVSSGESISVTVDAAQLRQITGVERLPETGAEKAVALIRNRLRDKKA